MHTSLVKRLVLFAMLAISASIQAPLERRGQFTGQATYYNPGLGACGGTNDDRELVGAMNAPQYAGSCGKRVTITGPKGSVSVVLVDLCPECAFGDLDLSSTAFDRIADQSAGRVAISWSFVGESAPPSPTTSEPTPVQSKTEGSPSSTPGTETHQREAEAKPSPTPDKVFSVSYAFFNGEVPFLDGATLPNGQDPIPKVFNKTNGGDDRATTTPSSLDVPSSGETPAPT